MTKALGSLIGKAFKYPNDKECALIPHFGVYFAAISMISEDTMSKAADRALPNHDTIVIKHETLSTIRSGIIMMLQNLAAYVVTGKKDNLYFSQSTNIDG